MGALSKPKLFGPNGAMVRDEFLVSPRTAKSQAATAVAGLRDGGFVIAWNDRATTHKNESEASIKVRVFDSSLGQGRGARWRNPEDLRVRYNAQVRAEHGANRWAHFVNIGLGTLPAAAHQRDRAASAPSGDRAWRCPDRLRHLGDLCSDAMGTLGVRGNWHPGDGGCRSSSGRLTQLLIFPIRSSGH